VRACHGCAHPSAQRQGLVAGPSPPLVVASLGTAAVWCRRRTPRRAVLFLERLRACSVGRAKRTPAHTRVAVYTATPCAWWLAERNRVLLAVRGRPSVLHEAVELVST
jgi:hypothetical protein